MLDENLKPIMSFLIKVGDHGESVYVVSEADIVHPISLFSRRDDFLQIGVISGEEDVHQFSGYLKSSVVTTKVVMSLRGRRFRRLELCC